MIQDTVAYAELEAHGCAVELYLNGIPVLRGGDEEPFASAPVEQFVVPGDNELELVVEPGTSPSRARTEIRALPRESARASARLVRLRVGDAPGGEEATLLGEVRFPPPGPRAFRTGDLGERLETFPQKVLARADAGAARGRWSWQDAPVLELGPALAREASLLLDEVAASIREGDAARLLSLAEPQIRDVSRAYPTLTEQALREDLEDLLERQRELEQAVLPRAPERHDFRLAAGGRLLECVDDDWTASLKLAGQRGPLEYPIFIARLGGRMRIVR